MDSEMYTYEELIKCAVEHLLGEELKEEEGWEQEEIRRLRRLEKARFKIVFEEE